MTTLPSSRLRRHPEIVGGPLVTLLFLLSFLFSTTPVQTWLFGIGPDEWGEVDAGPAVIPCALAMAVAVVVAFTSASTAARAIAWLAVPASVAAAFWYWFLIAYYGTDLAGVTAISEVLVWCMAGALPVLFLVVCRRSPRPDAATFVAEAVLLLVVGWALSAVIGQFGGLEAEAGERQTGAVLIFLGAAAYFGVAAGLVRTRRLFYGACALACFVVAAWGTVGGTTATGSYEGSPIPVVHPLLHAAAWSIPAIGALLQIAWHVRAKVRAVAA
ncbi:hypothetical protein [Glycomyces niveus]|uniref:Uncharacterized protein n=1 Tax=Glycomyces niveus TaxID=2820287 RepID=A0ABS3U8Y2_9ACTN|nr:hypothetical protein [Glycomyces sp. NEAU-S30]MBO3735225.1 hypothetical protein [Glycomyces sp. NEAU-S30]